MTRIRVELVTHNSCLWKEDEEEIPEGECPEKMRKIEYRHIRVGTKVVQLEDKRPPGAWKAASAGRGNGGLFPRDFS